MPITYPGIFIDHPHVWYRTHTHKYATVEERDAAFVKYGIHERCTALIELRDGENARHQVELRKIEEELARAQARCEHDFTNCVCVVCGLNSDSEIDDA